MYLKEKVYTVIKERITTGVYSPGQLLDEKEIIRELGISRTPFREAVNALNKENLVIIHPGRGIYVRDYSYKDMLELFDTRYILEPAALRAVALKIPHENLEALKAQHLRAIESENIDEMHDADRHFLSEIMESAGNGLLARVMSSMNEFDWLMVMHERSTKSMALALQEHITQIDAMLKGDPDLVEETARRHIIESRKRAMGLAF